KTDVPAPPPTPAAPPTDPLASPAACACPSPCPHSTNQRCGITQSFFLRNPDFHHGLLSTSVSNQWRREGNAAPRSQIFSEPINRNVGSCDSRSASFRSSYPAKRL